VRSLASSSRNWSPVKAVAPLVALLDLIDATSRIGLAPNTFAMTASASAPCRMVLACLAMFAPCAERIDRSAASRRAGDASPTRWPHTVHDYWLTRPEVGKRLKVPPKTLAQWASQKKAPRSRRSVGFPLPAKRRDRLGEPAIHRRGRRVIATKKSPWTQHPKDRHVMGTPSAQTLVEFASDVFGSVRRSQ